MSQHYYRCNGLDTRWIGRGIKAAYDGQGCLIVEYGHYISAINANPGEEFIITISGQFAEIKEM